MTITEVGGDTVRRARIETISASANTSSCARGGQSCIEEGK